MVLLLCPAINFAGVAAQFRRGILISFEDDKHQAANKYNLALNWPLTYTLSTGGPSSQYEELFCVFFFLLLYARTFSGT